MSGFLKGVRAVTHFDVTTEDCKYALSAVEECLHLENVSSNGKVSGKAKTELHEHINGTLKVTNEMSFILKSLAEIACFAVFHNKKGFQGLWQGKDRSA